MGVVLNKMEDDDELENSNSRSMFDRVKYKWTDKYKYKCTSKYKCK